MGTFLLLLGLVTIVMGCSGSDDTTSSEGSAAATQVSQEENVHFSSDGSATFALTELDGRTEGGKNVSAGEDSDVGMMLLGPHGEALYISTEDEPDKSNCTDDCIVIWPPLEGTGAIVVELAEDLFGSIVREDGLNQITFNGHPLYFFADDDALGDKKGHGVDGQWFVISPEGEPVN